VIKTAGDLAAAFAPMEGEQHIEQGESDKAVLVRSFKQSFEEAQAAAGKARKAARFSAEAKREQAQAKQDEDRPSAVGGPLKSRKDLREGGGPKPVALVLTEQQLAGIRKAAEGERKDDSVIGMLLFLLFVFLLPFATPLLRDPEQAKTVLRGNQQVVAGLFTVLTVVALVRTWALQIKSAPTLLRPVNTMLKIVTAAVCILGASFFFPGKQLGPPYRAAHMALPWLASGFYAFLALYGIARALREAGQGILRSVGMTVLYLGAFFGSYQVLASTVLSKAEQASQRGKRTGIAAITGNLLHDGKDEAAAEALLDAGVAADKPMQQRGEVGASEADDMAAIEELSRGKQEKGKQLNKLSEQMKDMVK
jgi:hypothetical protein